MFLNDLITYANIKSEFSESTLRETLFTEKGQTIVVKVSYKINLFSKRIEDRRVKCLLK